MRKIKQFVYALVIISAVLCTGFGFLACSSDDESNDTAVSPYAALPASSGTNPFSGKTWILSWWYDESEKWIFGADSLQRVTTSSGIDYDYDTAAITIKYYNYSFDSENSLLYLAKTKEVFVDSDGSTYSYSNAEEYRAYRASNGISGIELDKNTAEMTAEFATKEVYRYTIDEDKESLTLIDCFDGTLPTSAFFYSDFEDDAYPAISDVYINNGEIVILAGDNHYYICPSFTAASSTEGTFSGIMYERYAPGSILDPDRITIWSNLGSASGTYTISREGSNAEGTKGSTITLNFTEIPQGAEEISVLQNCELTQTEPRGFSLISSTANPFRDKTWTLTHEDTDETDTWTFGKDTARNVCTVTGGSGTISKTKNYTYTYDRGSESLYLTLTEYAYTEEGGASYSYKNAEEFRAWASTDGGLSGVRLEKEVARVTAEFNTKYVYDYIMEKDSLTLAEYFDGKLPSSASFKYETEAKDEIIASEIGGFEFKGASDDHYYIYPTFTETSESKVTILSIQSEGTFTGILYKCTGNEESGVWSTLGKASGTYTASEGNCTIELTFTELPEGMDAIEKEKPFLLEQEEVMDVDYTRNDE
ncbi:hypothetical protein [uncultured Treponema sp.]|uniref:hypothetical protein n=1 Tax=uncultured Treponema sp. TaxID=162155 RepID=UPI0025E25F3E|nr:hypothetical protein [uncultured Treponema sp.]